MPDEQQLDDELPAPQEDDAAGPDRSRDLLGRANSPIRKHLDKLFDTVSKSFQDQAKRSDDLDTWWNCYNCELDDNQFYNGNANVYVPIIRDAINARATRFANQLFPTAGRYIDCTSSDGEIPYEVLAIANHHISAAKLKNNVVKPLLRNGDVEGQYNLYVGEEEVVRQIVSRETRGVLVEVDGVHVEQEGEEIEDVHEEEVRYFRPTFEVLHDSDVAVSPANADSVEDALSRGGHVTILRRWSKSDIEGKADDGEIRKDTVDALEDLMVDSANRGNMPGLSSITKELIKTVGIRGEGKHVLVFETWTMLPLNESGQYAKDGKKRLCRVYMAIDRTMLGAVRNPYWNDRCPLLSAPVEKVSGVFKGKSQVEPLAPIQWEANNAANERADVDHYSAMPIIMRKPDGDNAPLILNLAAVWDTDPATTKFAEFPDLSDRARKRVQDATMIIFQSLNVNPAMIPQSGRPGSKRNQAELATEQQVDLLNAAEQASILEEGILTDTVSWLIDLDHQFRNAKLQVRAYGEMGVRAQMIDVPPIRNRYGYQFVWCGAAQTKMNAAMMQGGIGLLNVARGMAQQLKEEGFQLRVGPPLRQAFLNTFGPLIGEQTLVDQRRQLSIEVELEAEMLKDGFMVPIHPLDDDLKHLQAHMQQKQQTGDPHGNMAIHIQEHLKQAALKAQAMAQQQMQAMSGIQRPGGGAPGVPGGVPPRGPGVAGTPRMGAQPAMPRPAQMPAGAIHADRMMGLGGGVTFPRKM